MRLLPTLLLSATLLWAAEDHQAQAMKVKAPAPVTLPVSGTHSPVPEGPDNPGAALGKLNVGNARFVGGKRTRHAGHRP